MRLGALFSGGKDSAYAVYRARRAGHDVRCLLTAHARSPESRLLHHPATRYAELQARSMGTDWRGARARSDDALDEDGALDELVRWAKDGHGIRGLVHGGIRSEYQRRRFAELCGRHSLHMVAPVWGSGPGYMGELLRAGFRFAVVSVSAGGLDDSWLGRTVTEGDLRRLRDAGARHGVAADFEGGEAETFVVDCPMFSRAITLCGTARWDGYTGRFEISDAAMTG